MLGEADRPWLGVTLREPEVEAALEEAANLIAAGIDLIRIEIPIGRELADRLTNAGLDVPIWQPRETTGATGLDPVESSLWRRMVEPFRMLLSGTSLSAW